MAQGKPYSVSLVASSSVPVTIRSLLQLMTVLDDRGEYGPP
jgi:hypothetical protein